MRYGPAISENIGASSVKKAAWKTLDYYLPSGLDENDWRRIFICFNEVPANIAKIALCLAAEKVSEKVLEATCRLIPLHKSPRPKKRDWTQNLLSALTIWEPWEWGKERLNRKLTVENIKKICPASSFVVQN